MRMARARVNNRLEVAGGLAFPAKEPPVGGANAGASLSIQMYAVWWQHPPSRGCRSCSHYGPLSPALGFGKRAWCGIRRRNYRGAAIRPDGLVVWRGRWADGLAESAG